MNFTGALHSMEDGKAVTRLGWNGKHKVILHEPVPEEPSTYPYFLIFTESGACSPWLATHADLLAEDWEVVDT